MSPRVRVAFLAVVAAQLLFPLGVIGYNELKLARGKEVRLHLEPVDPTDFFRGEYVALAYDIATVDLEEGIKPGATVYVPLRRKGHYWTGTVGQPDRPSGETVFIRGRATSLERTEFGIETYFVQEGQSRRYEEAATRGDLFVDIALDHDGDAKIKRLLVIPQG